jgi:predicted membrane protein
MNDDQKFDANKFVRDLRDQVHRDIHEGISQRRSEKISQRLSERLSGKRRSFSHGLFWGVLLILLGVIFLLDNLGVISAAHIWRFWPVLLIIAGAFNVLDNERRFWGVILLVGGTFLLLNQLGLAHFSWAFFWPIILIAIGLMVLWNSLTAPSGTAPGPSGGGDPRLTVNGVAIFSGLERRMTSEDFQGGHVTAIFGGIELDLTEAKMQADEATLEVNAVFGGVELRIPDSWQVSYRGGPIFGGVDDKTRIRRAEDMAGSKPKVLHITGLIAFGGLDIKN